MRLCYKGLILSAALLVFPSLSAVAQTITFDTQGYANGQSVASPVIENGVELHATAGFAIYSLYGNPGLGALPNSYPADLWVVRSDGGAFDLVSLDFNNLAGVFPVKFIGLQVDGTVITQTINSNGNSSIYETLSPTGFTDLLTLGIHDAYNGQFDNIQTTASAATEPAGMRMMTFDNIGLGPFQSVSTVTQDGVQVTSPHGFNTSVSPTVAVAGVGIGMATYPSYLIISRPGGEPFDFLSIDYNETGSASNPVVFTGTKWVGGTVTETIMSDGNVDTYERMTPTGNFTMLTELRIDMSEAFDNIRIMDSMVLPTEPSTWGKIKSIYK